MNYGEKKDTLVAARETSRSRPARLGLPDEIRDVIDANLLGLLNYERWIDPATARLHEVFAELPEQMLQEILDFGRYANAPGVLLIGSLQMDPDLPPTSADAGLRVDKKTFAAEGGLIGISSLLGKPVSFVTEKDSRVVHDVIPTATETATQASRGSAVDLNFHNDIVNDAKGGYDVGNPDFLVLNFLRSDHDGKALIFHADARDILRVLDRSTIYTLRSLLFQLNALGGYIRMFAGGKQVLSDLVAIIGGPEYQSEISVAVNGGGAAHGEFRHDDGRACRRGFRG